MNKDENKSYEELKDDGFKSMTDILDTNLFQEQLRIYERRISNPYDYRNRW